MSDLKITGKIKFISQPVQVTDNFVRREVAVEIPGQYPKLVVMNATEKAYEYISKKGIGDDVTCSIEIESRESKGKYYTNVKCFMVS